MSGPVSGRLPESVSTTVVEPDEMPEFCDTCRDPASVPDMDQPRPVSSAVWTLSLKVTVILFNAVASAETIVGAAPSGVRPIILPPVSAAMLLAAGEIVSVMAPASTYR